MGLLSFFTGCPRPCVTAVHQTFHCCVRPHAGDTVRGGGPFARIRPRRNPARDCPAGCAMSWRRSSPWTRIQRDPGTADVAGHLDWRLDRAGLTLQHAGSRGNGELVLTGTAGQRLTARSRSGRGGPGGRARRAPCRRGRCGIGSPPWPGCVPCCPWSARSARCARSGCAMRTTRRSPGSPWTPWRSPDRAAPRSRPGWPSPMFAATRPRRGGPAACWPAPPGWRSSGQTALEAALSAAGRHALDYTGKVDVALGPAMPGAEAVRAILLQQLDNLEANVDGVLHDTDTEFLHDLRIAVRRTRSGLKLLGECPARRAHPAVRRRVPLARRHDDAAARSGRAPAVPAADGRPAGGGRSCGCAAVPGLPGAPPHRRTAEAQPGAAVGAVRRHRRRLAQGAARPA